MSAPAPAKPKKLWVARRDGVRTRRLGEVARRALAAYDVGIASLKPLALSQNWLYRLDTTDGRRFVVRVNRPGMRSALDVASEMAWLAALRRDTDLVVPDPLLDRSGHHVQLVDGPGPDEDKGRVVPHAVSVFGWIDGRNVGERVDPKLARAMGEAVGRLQDHADTFRPPQPFTTSTLDRVWTFGARPAWLDPGAAPHPWFTRERSARIARAAERGQARIDALHADRATLRFLHIDLHMGNVRRQKGGGLALLDFDDSRWAHPVQDFAIPLYYLWVRENGAELWDAYAEGYAGVRGDVPVDRRALLDLVAARQVDLLAFVLTARLIEDDAMPAWLERVDERLGRLEEG
jgi:Ser/Thr protein kinase RdoA (MazF antagonist)